MQVLKFVFRVSVMTAAVDFLLSGDNLLAVILCQERLERPGFGGCVGVGRRGVNVQVGHIRVTERDRVVENEVLASVAADFNRVFARLQIEEAEAEVYPVLFVRNAHVRDLLAVHHKRLRACAVQIHPAARRDFVHTALGCIHSNLDAAGVACPDESFPGIPRIRLVVDLVGDFRARQQFAVLRLRLQEDVALLHGRYRHERADTRRDRERANSREHTLLLFSHTKTSPIKMSPCPPPRSDVTGGRRFHDFIIAQTNPECKPFGVTCEVSRTARKNPVRPIRRCR